MDEEAPIGHNFYHVSEERLKVLEVRYPLTLKCAEQPFLNWVSLEMRAVTIVYDLVE